RFRHGRPGGSPQDRNLHANGYRVANVIECRAGERMLPVRLLAALMLVAAGFEGSAWCAQPKRVPAPEFFVKVDGDRVTVRIERGSLRHVLDELHRQAGVTAQFADPADDGTVWKTFADVPLVEALYRLLEGRSFVLYYNDAAPAAVGTSERAALVV